MTVLQLVLELAPTLVVHHVVVVRRAVVRPTFPIVGSVPLGIEQPVLAPDSPSFVAAAAVVATVNTAASVGNTASVELVFAVAAGNVVVPGTVESAVDLVVLDIVVPVVSGTVASGTVVTALVVVFVFLVVFVA